jgi:hypothetical protein
VETWWKILHRLFGQPLKGIRGPFEKGQMVEASWEAYRVVKKYWEMPKEKRKIFWCILCHVYKCGWQHGDEKS